MFELMVEEIFSAAHQLRGYEGPCENLHGHTWKVQVHLVAKTTEASGITVDFKVIKLKLSEAIKGFDHSNLNELDQFKKDNPTSENIAKVIYERIKGSFGNKAKVLKVAVFESPTSSAAYYE